MKPLPPLPRRKYCPKRGSGRGRDFTSRCILTRMKKQRVDDGTFGQGATIQQRRSGPTATAPPLILTLPPSTRQPTTRAASAMIWMPDEQMWLTAEQITGRNHDTNHDTTNNFDLSAYDENTFHYHERPNYPRSEPSPGPYMYYDITPPESPVLSQFRSLLVEPRDEERLSPLFQEAVQTVPMSDSANLYAQSFEECEQEREQEHQQSRGSERSKQESFHSAVEFLAEGPTRPHYRDHSSQARKPARPSSAMA
ncbi:MAG: hypothetical protein LQ343_000563 [Gyalolechia ehrenbergii]|nr:MAG: hypothetical protein LQ343_000563 [Gyalolechia ehrenbergii]